MYLDSYALVSKDECNDINFAMLAKRRAPVYMSTMPSELHYEDQIGALFPSLRYFFAGIEHSGSPGYGRGNHSDTMSLLGTE